MGRPSKDPQFSELLDGGDHLDISMTSPEKTLGSKRDIEESMSDRAFGDGDAFGDCEQSEIKKKRQSTYPVLQPGASQVSATSLDKQKDSSPPRSRRGLRGAGDAFATDGSMGLYSPALSPIVEFRGKSCFSRADDAEVPKEFQCADSIEPREIVGDLGDRYLFRVLRQQTVDVTSGEKSGEPC
ncbi:unnamed protein product [Ixodes persulcatus]